MGPVSFTEAFAERKLQQAEALLRVAAVLGRIGLWTVELRSFELRCCDQICAMHEVPASFQWSVSQALAFYAAEHRASLLKAFVDCMEFGIAFDLELEIVTAKQKRRWVRVIGEAERNGLGEIVRVRGALQDVDAAKRAGAERRRLAALLSETLETLPDAFLLCGKDWTLTYVNEAACALLGCSPDQLIGRNLWGEVHWLQESAAADQCRRTAHDRTCVAEPEFIASIGIWLRLRAWPVAGGVAICLSDVTQLAQAQAELRTSNENLEQRVEQRTAELAAALQDLNGLSYAIAHDLRAPLATISGFASALAGTEAHGLTERGRRYVDKVVSVTRKMDAMIDGLLGLARLSNRDLQHEEVDLSALAREALDMLQSQDPHRRVDVHIAPSLFARGDRVLLTLVLHNLLGNAWKFTSTEAAARIVFGSRADASCGEVFLVTDNGAGFDAAYADRLFKPFHRLHRDEEFPGTGIGLATVKRIVALHRGRIWAESAKDTGTCFYFTLHAAEE